MRRRNLFSIEDELEICRKHRSGEKQNALALEHGVSSSVMFRIIKTHSAVDSKFNCPSDAASSFPADSTNGQAFYPPCIYPNGMHPSMRYPPVFLAQEGAATSARPFSRPSGAATSVPAHVVYGPPPDVSRNGMQSNTDYWRVPLPKQGRPAFSARPWAGQAAFDAANHTFLVEQESEILKRYLSGQHEYSLASDFDVPPSSIRNLIQKYHSTGNSERSRPSITATSVPSHVAYSHGQNSYPSHLHSFGGRTGMPYVPDPLVQEGRAATLVRPSVPAVQIIGVANIEDAISHSTHSTMFIPSSRTEPQSLSFTAGVSGSASFDGSNQFGSRAVHASSGNQWMTHPPSGKAIDAQNNGFTPGSHSMMDTDAETLSGSEIRTQPPTDEAMTTLHLSEVQGYGSGQATLLLQTSCLPAASLCEIENSCAQIALKERVEKRVADIKARNRIMELLATHLIHNIPQCKFMGFEGLMGCGFSKRDSELLILDDNAWMDTDYDWIDTFLNTLPDFILVNTNFLDRVRTAINDGNISSRVEFEEKVENLNLPPGCVILLQKCFQKPEPELNFDPTVTSGSSHAQMSSIHDTTSVSASNDAAVSAREFPIGDNDDDLPDHDNTSDEEEYLDTAIKALSCGQPPGRAQNQEEGSGSQVSHHTCPPQSDSSAGLVSSNFASDVMIGAQNLGSLFSLSETAKSSESDKESVEAALEGLGTRGRTPQGPKSAGGFLEAWYQQRCREISAASLRVPSVSRKGGLGPLWYLFSAVLRCFPNFGGAVEGVSGTMAPISQVTIQAAIVQGLVKAVTVSKIEHMDLKFDFIDLGCSSGHALACAATLDFFTAIYGVDLPSNQGVLSDHFKIFMTKAEKSSQLSQYKGQWQSIKMIGANVGDHSKQNVTQLLGLESVNPSAVYWFNVGWNAPDILNAARILSNSPQVLCIAAVMRGNDSSGSDLLESLNENPVAGLKFGLFTKLPSLPMKGSGSFAAYIFVRSPTSVQCCEIEGIEPTPAHPQIGQRVEVLFSDHMWYPGAVASFHGTRGSIIFDDQTVSSFKRGDPEVFFMPREDDQWKETSGIEQDSKVFQLKFCIACNVHVDKGNGFLCARCNSSAVCFECERSGVLSGFICFICRAELADLGRSQLPLHKSPSQSGSTNRGIVCYGCKENVSGVLSAKVPIKNKYCLCRFCNKPFGLCCTSLTPRSKKEAAFACPACVGAPCHDAGLKLQVEAMSAEMEKCLIDISLLAKKGTFVQDEWGYSVTSLQINCQGDLLCGILPSAVKLLNYQLHEKMDPSIGPFDFLNLMVLMDGPNSDKFKLYQELYKMYFAHAKQRAAIEKSTKKRPLPANDITEGQHVLNGRQKLGFATADMRETPWWLLMKVALIDLAELYDLYIYSRPPCDLNDDPHFTKLKEISTIVDFPPSTEDKVVAETILEKQLDALVDAGGPTANSFTGVMALRPAKLQMAHLGFPGDQAGGHIDYTFVDQDVVDPDGIQGIGGCERYAYLPFYQPNASFRCDSVPASDQAAPSTTRSDWGLSEGRFVFALFCRLGRVDSEQAACLARILKRSPNSDLWLRATPLFALVRLLHVLRTNGIDRSRIIIAMDKPTAVHQERIRHADLGLDTLLYGGHTTASDFFRNGVPFLAVKGEWWHTRVGYGLGRALLGTDDLVGKDLKEFEDKAVDFSQGDGLVKLQREICPAIQHAIKNNLGIFDGPRWTSAFQRIVSEAIRQGRDNEPRKDIYSVERIRQPIKDKRDFVLVLDSQKVEKLNTASTEIPDVDVSPRGPVVRDAHDKSAADPELLPSLSEATLAPTAEHTLLVTKRSRLINMAGNSFATESLHAQVPPKSNGSGSGSTSEKDPDQSGSGCGDEPVSEQEIGSSSDEESLFLQNLSESARRNPDRARQVAYEYLMRTMPAGREIAQYQRRDGSFTYAIQLPLSLIHI